MKNIWIIDHYSSEPKYGGISRQYDFALELSRRGYRVIIVSSAYSHFTHTYITNAPYLISKIADHAYYVYVHTTAYIENGGMGRMKNIFSFKSAVKKYEKEIAHQLGKPDVVMGCSVHPLAWVAAYRVSKAYKVRFIVEVRDLWPEMWLLNGEKKPYDPMVIFFGAIERWAYQKADKIIYSMIYGDQYICGKLGFPKEKVVLIGQPMDCKRYDNNATAKVSEIPSEILTFIDDSFICVFTGYYMEYEGVYVMLQAAKETKANGLPIKYLFVGSGKEKDGMLQYAKENNLDHVLIYDRISKEAIPALLRKSDICLAHISTQGHPQSFKYSVSKNKVNEYLYADSCVIYGRDDKNDPVAQSGGGFVVTPYRAEEFVKRIQEVYHMPKDERAVFGSNGQKYIREHHEVGVLADKLLSAFFPEIMKNHDHRDRNQSKGCTVVR